MVPVFFCFQKHIDGEKIGFLVCSSDVLKYFILQVSKERIVPEAVVRRCSVIKLFISNIVI